MVPQRKIIILSLLIISVSSILENEDLIDLTDYDYPSPNDSYYKYIPILSTNDLHGGIFPEKFADINRQRYSYGGANYIYSYKKILKEEWGNRLLWFDAGDQFQGTMECMLSKCNIMKDYYNKAGLDGITLGNHDFDYGIDYLKKFIKEQNFPVICTNIKEKESNKYIYDTWDNVIGYNIYNFTIDETDPTKTIKIGVIGLATQKTASTSSGDVSSLIFTDYVEETEKWNKILREKYEVNAVIVVTHFGAICNNDEDDISYKSDENLEKEDEEEKQKISNKHKQKTSIQYRTKEEMEFQDEVDTPIDIPAKERFKKYRGLDSMKTGSWNPLINLPKEYRTIFSFENIKNTFRISVKRAHNDGLKLNGNYIKIIVTNFDFDNLKYYREEIPMVLSTLLDHERKLCVMHYKFTANYEQDNTIVENMNKNIFECHCGFRRYLIKPIFSTEVFTGGDKLKIQKYLEKDKFYIMSTYAQLTYPNSPIILFTHKTLDNNRIDDKLSFCGTGSTLEANDKKIILKKIVLTGYPVKIKKKKAIVRYMFFNPADINYFKPIQLTTKKGLRGNITESVGIHGYMKCIFSDYIKSNDTVCLNLYKRVFPKYFKETWKYKVFYGNREDYLSYFKPREIKEIAPVNLNENENKDKQE